MAKAKAQNVADAAAVPGSALVRLVRESGLEAYKQDYLISRFGDYQAIAEEYEATARTIVVTDASQTGLMARARKGRLFLRQMRIDIENTRKALKEQSLKEGKAIDGVSNALKALIEPTEDYLDRQERFVEIQEAERLAKRRAERYARAAELGFVLNDEDILHLSDDAFELTIESLKKKRQDEIERQHRETEERNRLAMENARLKAEADAREAALKAEREATAALNAKLAAEEKRRHDESMKYAAELEARATAERKATEEKAKAERDAEAARVKAEKKAAAAPDKAKLLALAATIDAITLPAIEGETAGVILDNVIVMLTKLSGYIKANAENL